ncbi:porin [Vibrio sp. S11_S32]|uniref:porin n=1 Tax=Vibrio sp. S11_S32 TaxID=2720225 RepID=UPI001680DA67|nr:porin [Vibrio sp. S11_S32]MBD1575633.1 porin [Vibrio sp. S11_S32]
MKKLLLSTLIPALLLSTAASAADIYKAEDGSHVNLYSRLGYNITNKGTNDQDTRGVFDGRIGLSGSQTINEHADVIGQAQYQVGAAEYANSLDPKSSDLTARYVWAGIDGHEYGKIKGGRVDSGLIMFTDIGDVFATSDVSMARQASMVDKTAVQVFRQDGTLQYQNTIGNLDVSGAYIFGNDTSNLDYGYNAALRYTIDMGGAGTLAPVVAYQQTKADDTKVAGKNVDGAEYKFWGVGTRYYLNKLMLGALYSQDEVDGIYANTSTDKVMEFTAVYDLNDDWAFRAGYRNLQNDGGDELELKDTTFEVQYKLTAMSSIYTTYELRNGENGYASGTSAGLRTDGFGGDADENFYSVGIRFEI